MEKNTFIPVRISKSASIMLNGDIDSVFPLFGAFEERKWAHGWQPVLLFPDKEIMEEGVTFTTKAHVSAHGEDIYTWTVAQYRPADYLVQYLVMTPNRFWTITVQCEKRDSTKTGATVTYTYTGLNEEGNRLNKTAVEKMYAEDLKDWERAVNHFLKKGEMLAEE